MPHKKLYIHTPPLYTAAASVYPYSKTLEQHFMVNTKYGDGPTFLAKKVGDYLHVPRELAPIGKDDRRSDGTPISVGLKIPPRDAMQTDLITQSLAYLDNGKSHTFQATMGFGKTYCAVHILTKYNTTTLICCTKEDLMVQWKENLLKYTDIKEDDIGLIQQDKCQYKDKKVVIGMIHSLAGIPYPVEVYDYFGLLINDEAHRMSADSFVNAMFKFTAKVRLSLTATPKRPDGKDFVFKAHSGDVLVKSSSILMPPKVLVVNSGWRLPTWKKRDPLTGGYQTIPIPHQAGRTAGIEKEMGRDDARNHLIADLCVRAYNKDRKIVIFFSQIDNHLKKLRPILIKMGIPSKDIKEYIGGLTEQQRFDNAKARVILGSYSYFSEGTDIPSLDTAILASPRSNIMQAVGRILRQVEGKKEPIIFDIVDECSPVLVGMHHSRMRQYNDLKAKIVKFS